MPSSISEYAQTGAVARAATAGDAASTPASRSGRTLVSLPTEVLTAIVDHLETPGDALRQVAATSRRLFDVVTSKTISDLKKNLHSAQRSPPDQDQWRQMHDDARQLRHFMQVESRVPIWCDPPLRRLTSPVPTELDPAPFDVIEQHLAPPTTPEAASTHPALNALHAVEILHTHVDAAGPQSLRTSLAAWIQTEHFVGNRSNALLAARDIFESYTSGAEMLHLDDYALSTLPDALCEVLSLKFLSMANNRIEVLPQRFGRLRHLEHLDVCNNRLTSVLDLVRKLPQLEYLDIGHNRLTALPENFGHLVHLRILSVAGNQLQMLPASMTACIHLEHADLSHNRCVAVPMVVCTWEQLTDLRLNNNHISAVPNAIAELTALSCLDISNNPLGLFPHALIRLRKLKTLDLSGTHLQSLPALTRKLRHLEYLNLSHNHFSVFPDVIKNMWMLRELNIRHNHISDISDIFSRTCHLHQIDARHNPMTSAPLQPTRRKRVEILVSPARPT